jgi:hypothetical protein
MECAYYFASWNGIAVQRKHQSASLMEAWVEPFDLTHAWLATSWIPYKK